MPEYFDLAVFSFHVPASLWACRKAGAARKNAKFTNTSMPFILIRFLSGLFVREALGGREPQFVIGSGRKRETPAYAERNWTAIMAKAPGSNLADCLGSTV